MYSRFVSRLLGNFCGTLLQKIVCRDTDAFSVPKMFVKRGWGGRKIVVDPFSHSLRIGGAGKDRVGSWKGDG